MKKMFILSMLIASAMICSCQKQDSGAEAQLAQRKTELDVREEALVQRDKAVDERVKAVAKREKAVANSRIIQSQRQLPDAAQFALKNRVLLLLASNDVPIDIALGGLPFEARTIERSSAQANHT